MLCVWTDTQARAYPLETFQHCDEDVTVTEMVGTSRWTVQYEAATGSLRLLSAPDSVYHLYSYWFAWYAFHPETTVFDPVEYASQTGRQLPGSSRD